MATTALPDSIELLCCYRVGLRLGQLLELRDWVVLDVIIVESDLLKAIDRLLLAISQMGNILALSSSVSNRLETILVHKASLLDQPPLDPRSDRYAYLRQCVRNWAVRSNSLSSILQEVIATSQNAKTARDWFLLGIEMARIDAFYSCRNTAGVRNDVRVRDCHSPQRLEQLLAQVGITLKELVSEEGHCDFLTELDAECLPEKARVWDKLEGGIARWESLLSMPENGNIPKENTPTDIVNSVVVSLGDCCYFLEADNGRSAPLNLDQSKVFSLFVGKILGGSPGEIVSWGDLYNATQIVTEDRQTANCEMRKWAKNLNDVLRETLGQPPKSKEFLITCKKRGKMLNTSVTWTLSAQLKKQFTPSSGRTYSRSPQEMEQSLANREERLPARSTRHQRRTMDDDN